MSPSIAQAAAQLGVKSPSPDLAEVEKLLADGPPQSNTLKRMIAHNRGEQLVSRYSLAGQFDAEMDAAADAEWNKKMDTALRATSLREKLQAQREAEEFFADAEKVSPEDPEWPAYIAGLAANKPRGFSDPRVQQVIEMQKTIHEVARSNAEKLRLEEDRKAEHQARRLDSVKLRAAELPEASQVLFRESVAGGADPIDALGTALGHSAELSARAKLAAGGLTPEEIASASAGTGKDTDTSRSMLLSAPRAKLTDDSRIDPAKAAAALKEKEEGDVMLQEYRGARNSLTQNLRAKAALQDNADRSWLRQPEEQAAILQDLRDLDEDIAQQREIIKTYETQRGLRKPAPPEVKTRVMTVDEFLSKTPAIKEVPEKLAVLYAARRTESDPVKRARIETAIGRLSEENAKTAGDQDTRLQVTASTPIVTTRQEYEKLPPGTLYINPSGLKSIKPGKATEEDQPK